ALVRLRSSTGAVLAADRETPFRGLRCDGSLHRRNRGDRATHHLGRRLARRIWIRARKTNGNSTLPPRAGCSWAKRRPFPRPGSPWRNRARARQLHREISKWRQQPDLYPATRPELAALKTLEPGQVTSIAPGKLGGLSANLRVMVYLAPLAAIVSMLTHAEIW